ncbi:MAG: ABC transporter permease [Bacteroidota bacterium]|nr:ABC transporter permease [Bacteroidota bacterium]
MNTMLHNHLRIALRNLSSRKGYAVINILGLATGIAVCLLIFLVIRFETSFDNFHKHRDHIYRVVSVFKTAEGIGYEPGVPFPTAQALRHDYPQLKNVATILSLGGSGQISIPDDRHDSRATKCFREETGVLYAEPEFFSMFDFKWLAGDKPAALHDPNSVVLTRSVAEKYFGDWKTAIGRVIQLDNNYLFKVTGILDDMPANTDFPIKLLISYSTLKNMGFTSHFSDWTGIFAQHYCFVELPDNLSEARFNRDLVDLVRKYKPAGNQNEGMMLLPLKEMHFDTRYSTFHQPTFSRNLIFALSLIGFFVLLIACVNFINLATAQAVNRSKEVGIRKVLGSTRWQLLTQFLGEAALLIVVATGLAIGICAMTLPYFNHLLGIKIDQSFIKDPEVMETLALIAIGATLLAGFYPAFVISGFSPITAFKNKAAINRPGALSLRRVLVVLQFSISQTLIICVLIVVDQMAYFKSAPMGFDKDAILITQMPDNSKMDFLRQQLLRQAGVENVSFSFASPLDVNSDWNSDIIYNGVKTHDFGVNLKWADSVYPHLYHMQLLAGRLYTGGNDIVVNEAFLRKLGIRRPQDALGATVELPKIPNSKASITGVVRDFNIASLHDSIRPVMMQEWREVYSTVNIKLSPAMISQALPAIEKLWKTTFPDNVYEYAFLDESIARYYQQEAQMSVLYRLFAGIAIFISCLGLYSLASFMSLQRAKEVGIRKTLGASVSSIVYLFSKEFTLLTLVAFFLSAPIGWYFMHRWLQNYAFHINPGPVVFFSALSISVIIAWLSVGYKALSTARANPVESLRSE